jgi:outer membrane protein TolC
MLNKNHLTVSKKLNELTTRTYKIGGKSKIEWLQSKANLLSLEQQAEEIEIEIKDGLVKLSQVAGTTDAQADVVTYLETATLEGLETDLNRIYKINSITPLLIERLGNGDRDDFISKLRGSSPVFKLYDLETTAASVQSQQHLATHLPSITIKGDVTKRGYQWGDVLNRHNNARNIGVYLSIPLFSGGSLFAHHRIETTQELINQQNKTISYKQLEDKLYSSFSTILQNYKILQLKSKYLLEKEEIVKLKEFSYSKGNILYEDLALEITDYWRELLEYRKSMSVTGETIIDLCAKAGLSNLLQ